MDWDDPRAQQHALTLVLDALTAVEHWLTTPGAHVEEPAEVAASMAVAQQVCAQDVSLTPAGGPALRHGVAEDRRISVADPGDAPWAEEPEPPHRRLQAPRAA
jgi:hypothetical protein